MKIGIHLYDDSIITPNENFGNVSLNNTNLLFAKQIGLSYIVAHFPLPVGNGYWEFLDLLRLRKYIESFGLKIGAIENLHPLHMDKIFYGEDNRDYQIKNVCKTIVNIGKAGIKSLGICFMIDGVWGHWRKGEGGGRGNAGIKSFNYELVKDYSLLPRGEFWEGHIKADYYNGRDMVGEINRDKMWDRFTYFLERIIPVVEESGVRLCVHPSDPPAPKLRGIERILISIDDFKKMLDMFPSKYLGLDFCQGTFTEMEGVGKNVIEAIRYFGKRKKIFYVHFRNVKGTFPKFDETFIDDGDVDMVEALRAYNEIGFDGLIVPDHTPMITSCKNQWHTGMAFAVGYMKGIMKTLGIEIE